jgi:hypothetical protein
LGILTLKLTNKGNTRIDLREKGKEGGGLCILRYALLEAGKSESPVSIISVTEEDELDDLGGVFLAHKWIEPSETIDDVRAIHIRDLDFDKDPLAVQFEILVYGKKKWTASAAFPLAGTTAQVELVKDAIQAFQPPGFGVRGSATSEDEQDDYTEVEKIRLLLRGRIYEGNSILSKGRAGVKKEALTLTIQEAHTLLPQLGSCATRDIVAQARERLNKLNEILKRE